MDGGLTVGAGRKRGVEYLVKWEGYSAQHNSWEPAANILDRGLIADYEARLEKSALEQDDHGNLVIDGFVVQCSATRIELE